MSKAAKVLVDAAKTLTDAGNTLADAAMLTVESTKTMAEGAIKRRGLAQSYASRAVRGDAARLNTNASLLV
ncbi:hypothetical protein EVAR_87205_1 [Eumeta japonica]|uniref:Uncharacterized protein n=1 Tax=Eumeta variegata TaxID=151549 RepID=A0A4C1VXK5_EUMVA|nr:hypothetical protein EVAR_87205_1 [Eumeta japonica]